MTMSTPALVQMPKLQTPNAFHHWGAINRFGEPCAPCIRGRVLQEKIEACRKKKACKALILEYQQAAQEINAMHDPLGHVPVEIISHIFHFTLPPFALTSDTDPKSSYVEALTLGAVCSKWRKVAWTTPALWKAITLSLSHAPTSNQVEVVRQWLSRSKALSLSIHIHFNFNWLTSSDHYIMVLDLIKHFNANSKRWETLVLKGLNYILQEFTGNHQDGAPIMKRLEIAGYDIEDGASTFAPFGKNTTPKQVSISGFSMKTVKLLWRDIIDVRVHDLSVRDCIRLLQDAPRLATCSFTAIRQLVDGGDSTPIPDKPHTHFHLSTLTLISGDASVLDYLVLPALQDLFITGTEGDPLPCETLITFFRRSSCALISLQLEGFMCSKQETLDVLAAVPKSLLVFSFLPDNDEGFDPRSLFRSLNTATAASESDEGTSPSLLPNLEFFYYRIWNMDRIPESDLFRDLRCPVAKIRRPIWMVKIIHQSDAGEDGPLEAYRGPGPSPEAAAKLFELERRDFELHLTPEIDDYLEYVLDWESS